MAFIIIIIIYLRILFRVRGLRNEMKSIKGKVGEKERVRVWGWRNKSLNMEKEK